MCRLFSFSSFVCLFSFSFVFIYSVFFVSYIFFFICFRVVHFFFGSYFLSLLSFLPFFPYSYSFPSFIPPRSFLLLLVSSFLFSYFTSLLFTSLGSSRLALFSYFLVSFPGPVLEVEGGKKIGINSTALNFNRKNRKKKLN